MSILEQLYNGKISPIESIVPQNAAYRPISQKIGNEREYFAEKLSTEDKERFEAWNTLVREHEEMTEYANFSYGFRLGVMLTFEIFAKDKSK